MQEIILLITSYLIGSISASIVLCKLFNLPDPRTQGSKNAGATNVLRYAGKTIAFFTLLIDILKGVLPVLVAKYYFNLEPMWLGFIAFAAFLGHLYPIYFRFQGGKGVATAFGVFLALDVTIGLGVVATWITVALLFRISSLASLMAAIAVTAVGYYVEPQLLIPCFAMSGLMFWRHRSNIERLLRGEEPKIGKKKR